MTIRRIALLLVLLAANGQALATGSSLSKREAIGKALFAKDRAAWLATDQLMESAGGLPGDVLGWVTLPSDGGWRVFFVQKEGEFHCSRLTVQVNEDGASPLHRSDTCEPLNSDQRSMFLSRQVALSALRSACSDAYNTIVLPYEGPEATWAVYLLAATQDAGKVIVGGHVRVLVRDDGLDVVDYQQLSKACLTLDKPSGETGEPVAFVVTHFLDDYPIETHVFLSLFHELKFYVMTESAMWSVAKGEIRLLMDGEDYTAYLERAKAAHDKEPGEGDD